MKLKRVVYVSLRCSDPDWDGTVTQQTNIRLLSSRLFIFLKVLYLYSVYVLIINPLLQELVQ